MKGWPSIHSVAQLRPFDLLVFPCFPIAEVSKGEALVSRTTMLLEKGAKVDNQTPQGGTSEFRAGNKKLASLLAGE